MEPITSIILIGLLALVAFLIARFVLRLAGRIIVFILTAIIALGILWLLVNWLL
jgi:hypothetical protein